MEYGTILGEDSPFYRMIQSENKPTDRLGGREKAPLVVKVRLEGSTAMDLIVSKPRNMPTTTFCAVLIEFGLQRWSAIQETERSFTENADQESAKENINPVISE